jgi:anti-sigma factor RsiW
MDQWTDRLSEYLDDELSPSERALVEAHLKDCEACTAVLDELRAVTAQAVALPSTPPSVDLWPGIEARLERRAVVTPFRGSRRADAALRRVGVAVAIRRPRHIAAARRRN